MPTNLLTKEIVPDTKDKPVNLLPELARSTPDPEKPENKPFIKDIGNAFMTGLSRTWATVSRIPASVYDLATIPQNFLMKAIGRDDLQVQSPEWLMDNPVAELYDYQTEAFKKQITPTKSFEEAFKTKDFDGIGRHIAIQVVENAPHQIGIILSYMAGYPNIGIAGMGMLETTSSLKEARKEKKDPAMSAYNSLTKGVIEAGFETIGTMGILKKWSRTLTKSFGTKNAKLIMGDIFKTVFHSMLGEGNEEFWTSLAQDFSDFTTGINNKAMKGSLVRATEAGTVGAVSGGLLTGPGAIRIGHASASLNKMKEQVNKVRETLEQEKLAEVEAKKAIPPEKPAIEPPVVPEVAKPPIVEPIAPKPEVKVEPEITLEEAIAEEELPREERLEVAKTELAAIGRVTEFLKGRVKTKEFEGRKIPRTLRTTDPNQLSLDEALDEVNAADLGVQFANESELLDFIEREQARVTELKEEIKGLRPARITKLETTVQKEKLQNIQRGIREGRIQTKKEIKTAQTEIIELLEIAELEAADKAKFIRTIKNIQTREQLEKALPEIMDRISKLAEKAEKDVLVREINRFARVKVDADYREQIDEILEDFDLKRRTEVTKIRRQKKAEFIERQREEGNLDFLPPDFFTDFGKKTLDEMSLGEVEQLRDQIRVLATVGATKNRLLAIRGKRDFVARLNNIIETIYKRVGKKEQIEGEIAPLVSAPERGIIAETQNLIDNFFAVHRKVEFITKSLQVNNDIFETIQDGINKELTRGEEIYTQLQEAFKLIENFNKAIKKEVAIEGTDIKLTRQQMIGVALNNGNLGNRQRLMDNNKFTPEQIRTIEKQLTPDEKKFVDKIFEIVDSLFPETVNVTKKLVGIKPKKVEGKYFPIWPDYELSKYAKLRQAQRDLFQDVFHITFVERGFTKERTGGTAPLDLNVFGVIFKHVDSVIHYNSLAIPVRDIQKITNNIRFRKAITEGMSENVYRQFPLWLRDIANPKGMQASNAMDKISQMLRHNATAAILGWRLTVSLLQGGSITLTTNEIGMADTINGVAQFYKNPKQAIEFVYSKSPIMKNRKHRFDREIRDWLKTKAAKQITQGRKSYQEMLFELIRGVDFITTMPSWLGAYEKSLRETGDVEAAAREADGVVRRTQPAAAMENLSAIMRGSATQKLFTSFMTHFSNMHNQLVYAMDELKYSKNHPLRKSANFARSMWWVWVAPALLAGWIRSGFKVDDWRKFAQELVLYPFTGMFLIRDIMGAIVKGFDFGAPPGLSAFQYLSYAFKGKELRTKLKHGIKAIGLLTGRIPTQLVDTIDGFIDLMNDATRDFRRLIWSEAAIKPVTKGIFAKPKGKELKPI